MSAKQAKICHISDWHFSMKAERCDRKLPAADLYVCTGDMLPNAPLLEMEIKGKIVPWRPEDGHILGHWEYDGAKYPGGQNIRRVIDHFHEREMQGRWLRRFVRESGGFEELLGNHDAPVVCVRGNHDFTDIGPLFDGHKGPVFEFGSDVVFEIPDIGKVAGIRGIPFICGEWSDELHDAEMQAQVDRLPDDFDLLVTHTPPSGILAGFDDGLDKLTQKWRTIDIGARQLTSKINRLISQNRKFVHCFGHNHDCGGQVVEIAGCTFSNAATVFNVIPPYKMLDYEVKK